MLRLSILTSRQKKSGHKVSMSRHSALCHDSGLRRCVADKAGCTRDKGALSPMTDELFPDKAGHSRQACAREWDACTTGVLCRHRLIQRQKETPLEF